MPAWIGPAIAASSSLLGGILGRNAQSSANRTNVMLQRENRDWMERMENTAWQRGTKDMLAAGLNPMLAYSQGPAGTPNSSAATVEPEDAFARGVNSAGAVAMQQAQVKQQRAQANLLDSQREGQDMQNEVYANINMLDREDGMGFGWQQDLKRKIAETQTAEHKAQLAKTDAQIREIERKVAEDIQGYQVSSAKSMAAINEKEVNIKELQKILMELDIPEKQALATWFSAVGAASPAMKATMSISQWLYFIFGRK